MEKKFCPKCGNKTLKRVSVTVDENGEKKIHLNPKVVISGKGKRFPLPKPKGGKHVEAPILVEDQKICQDRPTRSARRVNDVFRDDLVEGESLVIILLSLSLSQLSLDMVKNFLVLQV